MNFLFYPLVLGNLLGSRKFTLGYDKTEVRGFSYITVGAWSVMKEQVVLTNSIKDIFWELEV